MHIVINGANRGIGLAMCELAKAKGHQVTALCRASSEALQCLQTRVVEGVESRNPPEMEGFEPIDWLILNAGIWRDEYRLNLEKAGVFWNYRGEVLPW